MDLISADQAFGLLPVSLPRSTFYRLINNGNIPLHRFGRRIYINRADFFRAFPAAQVAA